MATLLPGVADARRRSSLRAPIWLARPAGAHGGDAPPCCCPALTPVGGSTGPAAKRARRLARSIRLNRPRYEVRQGHGLRGGGYRCRWASQRIRACAVPLPRGLITDSPPPLSYGGGSRRPAYSGPTSTGLPPQLRRTLPVSWLQAGGRDLARRDPFDIGCLCYSVKRPGVPWPSRPPGALAPFT